MVRPGALGDVVLTLPSLRALRARFPSAHVSLVAPAPQVEVAAWDGVVDATVDLDAPALAPLFGGAARVWPAELQRPDFAVLWLRDHAEMAGTLRRLGVQRSCGSAPLGAIGRRAHMAQWLVDSLALLKVDRMVDRRRTIRLPMTAEAHDGRYIVLHPGSGSRRKNWPWWAEAVAGLPELKVVITAGPADAEAVSALLARWPRGRALPLVRETPTLADLASELAGAALFLGNDSGVSHLAAALGVRSVVVFGPTDPAIWQPVGPAVTVLGGVTVLDGVFAAEPVWPAVEDVVRAAKGYVE
ncbi:MAG TPA: glycosyltransferase family 9 protein [Chloroflexota bacterium]|nr:glycosyltransferase family 9 protein [Chloroflexota bacterium]